MGDTRRRVSELTSEGTQEKHNMYRTRNLTIALTTALALSACSDTPVGPGTTSVSALASGPTFAKTVTGTGLVLDNVTGLSLPLIGHIGDVTINQAVITQLGIVQDLAGNIIGVDAQGALQLTGSALGTDVVTQNFTTDALILSSGKGQCDVVTIDLAPITLDALGGTVSVDVPQASVTPRASGAVGPLLCNLGSLLNAPVGQVTSAVRGIVNAINQIII
jgi:hypothetical protein